MGSSASCGQQLAKRQVEELAQIAAVDFEDFYENRRPARSNRGDLLVISADGKGIVMRPDALRLNAALAPANDATYSPTSASSAAAIICSAPCPRELIQQDPDLVLLPDGEPANIHHWRAFLPAITGFGPHQPRRYAAFLFTRILNFRV